MGPLSNPCDKGEKRLRVILNPEELMEIRKVLLNGPLERIDHIEISENEITTRYRDGSEKGWTYALVDVPEDPQGSDNQPRQHM